MTALNERALLPCPFCGGAAKIVDTGPNALAFAEGTAGEDDMGAFVYCISCGASTREKFGQECQPIDDWNRRAPYNASEPDAVAEERAAQAATDVLAERRRQVETEGWVPQHDDMHDKGELARAAICYADPLNEDRERPPAKWPWDFEWWKPKNRRRDLVRAGALILAEIERLDRAAIRARKE